MNTSAFFKLNYGVYIISASADGRDAGCVINTLTQVTSQPARLSIALNKNNETLRRIEIGGSFSAVVLAENVDMALIRRFGFQSSRDADKFDGLAHGRDSLGNPYPTDGICARFACRVIGFLDAGTHTIVLGEVTEAELADGEGAKAAPLTYTDYHVKKKGSTPPSAPSFQPAAPQAKGYRCSVCGYILEADVLPPDFICPVCGKDASYFVKL